MIIVMPLIVPVLRWRRGRMMIAVMAIIVVAGWYRNLHDFRAATQPQHGHRSQQQAGHNLWSNHRLSFEGTQMS
jgi:hypothetical protein